MPSFSPFIRHIRLILIPFLFSTAAYSADFLVNSENDMVDVTPGDGVCETSISGECTLRAAVIETNALAGPDTIELPSGLYTLSLGSTDEDESFEGDLDILDDLFINGDVDNPPVISGGKIFRIMSVLSDGSRPKQEVVLKNLHFTEGKENLSGEISILLNYGTLLLDNVFIENAGPSSIAIANFSSYLAIINSQINDNDRAIYSHNGYLVVADSELKRNINTVESWGAAIITEGGTAKLQNVIIENNTSLQAGAGISANLTDFTINSTKVLSNRAIPDVDNKTYGGGLYFVDSSLVISDSQISSNESTVSGGGLFFKNGNLSIERSIINNNKSDGAGGGIIYIGADINASENSLLNINESVITENMATFGGGIMIPATEELDNPSRAGNRSIIRNSEISKNTARFGGAMHFTDLGNLTIENSTLSDNTAFATGGGLVTGADANTSIDLLSVTIAHNSSLDGGNLYNNSNQFTLSNSIIANAVDGGDCVGISPTSLGGNLDSDNSCALDHASDLPEEDPLLGPLADNGGFSKTRSLLNSSPAINSGNSETCEQLQTLDQRFFYRGSSCDIGAVEFDAALADTGKLSFTLIASTTFEDAQIVNISIQRTGGSEGSASAIIYPITSSTATIGTDYYFTPSRLTWEDGDTSDKTLSIELIDNTLNDGDKNIQFVIAEPSDNVTLDKDEVYTLTIKDDELLSGKIEFLQNEFIVNETDSTAEIIVVRKNGTAGDVNFTYSLGIREFNASIKEGEKGTILSFNILPFQNDIYDGDQTIRLSLLQVDNNANIGSKSTTSLIVKDDESRPAFPGIISFAKNNYSTYENRPKLEVEIIRTEGSDGKLLVTVDILNESAKFNSDFLNINGERTVTTELLFEDGQKSSTLVIDILNDTIEEERENFIIQLRNVRGGASLNTKNTATIYVSDDDTPEYKANNPNSGATSSEKLNGGGLNIYTLILILLSLCFLRREGTFFH